MYDSIHSLLVSAQSEFIKEPSYETMEAHAVVQWLKQYLDEPFQDIHHEYYFSDEGCDKIRADFQAATADFADIVQLRLPSARKLLELPFRLQPSWQIYGLETNVDLPQMPTMRSVPDITETSKLSQ